MTLKSVLAVSALGCLVFAHASTAVAGDANDSIPSSHGSPEGAAVDLVRAFMTRDFHAFDEARTKSFCEGRTDPFNFYVRFRNNTTFFSMGESLKETDFPSRLLKICRVYSAQPLKTKEQLSVASAFPVSGYIDPTLVDVVVEDRLGNELLHRTIVVKSKSSGLWYARPRLIGHELLSELLLQLPKSESVSWRIGEGSGDRP
ncbi:MAG: hypothetical protein AAF989_06080 [Planctomycetota bacterium]